MTPALIPVTPPTTAANGETAPPPPATGAPVSGIAI